MLSSRSLKLATTDHQLRTSVGSVTVQELLSHGHQVIGLARNDASAEKLKQAGAESIKGDLNDLESLKAGAAAAEGIVHLAFILDPDDFTRGVTQDKIAIEAMAEAIKGTGKPLVFASGTMVLPSGKVNTEDAEAEWDSPYATRAKVDLVVQEMSKKDNIRGITMRLPPSVHGEGDKALVPMLRDAAKRDGFVVYVDQGDQHWPAVHRKDAAAAFRLALEKGRAGATYHPVAEKGVQLKDIASTIAAGLGLPAQSKSLEEAQKMLGFLAMTLARDHQVSSDKTRSELGWEPKEAGVLEDMKAHYF